MSGEAIAFIGLGYWACCVANYFLHCWVLKRISLQVASVFRKLTREDVQALCSLTWREKAIGVAFSAFGPVALISLLIVSFRQGVFARIKPLPPEQGV